MLIALSQSLLGVHPLSSKLLTCFKWQVYTRATFFTSTADQADKALRSRHEPTCIKPMLFPNLNHDAECAAGLQSVMDCQLVASSSTACEAGDAVNASGRQLFAQFKQLLEAAEAKVTGYDELHALLQNEQRSVGQLERALQLQQRHIDRFTAQDLLLAQLTQQMAIQAQALEQLQSTCRQQKQQLASAKAEASQLQQEVGHKRKRIEALEWHGAC